MTTGFALTPQEITGIFTLLGIIIGGGIGFVSSYCMGRINKRREASDKLRAAFAPELANMRLSAHKEINIDKMLTEAFPKHSAAIEEFSFYVPKKKRLDYFEAWEKYYMFGGSIRFTDYLDIKITTTGEAPSKMNNRELFEERVRGILKFAKPK